jgi:hypothetical protein
MGLSIESSSSLPPSSSFALHSGMGFMAPFQPGYIGNPLHPGHFGGTNSM